jgi:hypothetical protein
MSSDEYLDASVNTSSDVDQDASGSASSDKESDAREREVVDYSIVHAVPGHQKPLNSWPRKSDPLFVGSALPSALDARDLDEDEEREEKGGAVYVFVSF